MKFLLTLLGILFYTSLFTQAGNDLFAPDFTVTDLSGTTHQLYPILEQNKAVILMVGATWHTDCWQYHNSGILNTLYQQYGPGGSDQLRVFLVEGDPATAPECLTNLPWETDLPLRLWPLPAAEQVWVELPDGLTNEAVHWTLRTLPGQQIRSGQTVERVLTIPVADLPEGCYILHLNVLGRLGGAKVLVQH